jgi:Mg/Co/Ni transporter MgtE
LEVYGEFAVRKTTQTAALTVLHGLTTGQVIIEAMTDVEINDIMNKLFADDAEDFIEEMSANVVKRIL